MRRKPAPPASAIPVSCDVLVFRLHAFLAKAPQPFIRALVSPEEPRMSLVGRFGAMVDGSFCPRYLRPSTRTR